MQSSFGIDEQVTLPLPEHPAVAAMASALRDTGSWVEIVGDDWRHICVTDDLRLSYKGLLELASVPIGQNYFGAEALAARLR